MSRIEEMLDKNIELLAKMKESLEHLTMLIENPPEGEPPGFGDAL